MSITSSHSTDITLSADVLIEIKELAEPLWQKDHAEFIANYNAIVEQENLPLQEWRYF